MKEVTLDVLGRICIPKDFRQQLDLKTDSKVCITKMDDKLIITKGSLTNKCPVCSNVFSIDYKFCPHCGQYLMGDTNTDAE